MLEKFFHLKEHGTTISTEILAGLTTYITMSYVIFVQPAVLSRAGMDFGSVMTATCVSSAIGSILMGYLANLPVAQAPAMGHNFFFVFTVCGAISMGGYGFTWQAGLGAILIAGTAMTILSQFGMRDKVVQAMPLSLKFAIPAGIGLFITLIGMQWGGIVVANPGTMISLGSFTHGPAWLVLITVLVIALLMALEIRGSILIGIFFATVVSLFLGYAEWHGVFGLPASIMPTFLSLDVFGALSMPRIASVVFIFFILDLFDTIGTLTAVCSGAGLMKGGYLPKAREALTADGVATVAGSLLGTTTVTSYIESASGVASGGRTGLTAIVTGILFIFSLVLYPLAKSVGGGFEISEGVYLYPVIAPALIIVGFFMVNLASKIEWESPTEGIPAFLTMVAMPFTYSITEGVAFGIISYSLLHTGYFSFPKTSPIIHFLAVIFLARYLFIY
ncbi:MAG: NCS2 family permease [Nitrospinota bacterium]|nr:NCS2 family permease [Nitrospinota bacterium]